MRRAYIDSIRTGTVLLVFVYHVFYMYNGVIPLSPGTAGPLAPDQPQDTVLYLLYPWFMVLLFLVSGMCARWSLEKTSRREFLRARTEKLLVPSTLGLVTFHFVSGAVSMALSGASDLLSDNGIPAPVRFGILCLSGTGPLWFIQTLWLFSLIPVLVPRGALTRLETLADRVPCSLPVLWTLAVPVWGAGKVLNTPVVTVYRFGIYGLVFLLGYFLFSREACTNALARNCCPLGTAALILAVLYVLRYHGQNYTTGPALSGPLAVAFLWTACLAILGLMKRFGDHTWRFSAFWNRGAWGIYVFHYLPVSLCGLLFSRGIHLPAVWVYLLTALFGLIGALALYEIISRVPVLRWCVLGIRTDRGHNQKET